MKKLLFVFVLGVHVLMCEPRPTVTIFGSGDNRPFHVSWRIEDGPVFEEGEMDVLPNTTLEFGNQAADLQPSCCPETDGSDS